MDEVFPTLTQIPLELRTHLQEMINCLVQANSQGELPKYKDLPHMYKVFDGDGILRCLFKRSNERSAKTEASVYLLDHPIDGHRSASASIYGFSGVLPTVFVRFRNGNTDMMGVLIEFVKAEGDIEDFLDEHPDGTQRDEIHKISLLDVRFGNIDRSLQNILVQVKNGVAQLVPIDHEYCLSTDGPDYNICNPCWLYLEEEGANLAFSQDSIAYVDGLDVNADIAFLMRCGWEPEADYIQQFRVFTIFLKKAVSQGLTAYHIGRIAAFKCNDPQFNLQTIVKSVEKDQAFFANVGNLIDERLEEYPEAEVI